MWDANINIPAVCIDYLKVTKNKKMIQIGSSSEYGPMPRASAEIDRINPVDMYQATKGAATLLCQGYARQYKLDISIARPYSVYGPGEKPHRLFPRLYRAFMKDEPMKLFQGFHDFIYIDDFIKGIHLMANRQGDPWGEIVNFGSGVQFSNFVVAEIFEKVVGHKAPITIETHMAKPFESSVWTCDTSYAKSVYKFMTEYTLEDGIKRFLEQAKY
jgi:nucleoside-diphosphate-sugar epimerase